MLTHYVTSIELLSLHSKFVEFSRTPQLARFSKKHLNEIRRATHGFLVLSTSASLWRRIKHRCFRPATTNEVFSLHAGRGGKVTTCRKGHKKLTRLGIFFLFQTQREIHRFDRKKVTSYWLDRPQRHLYLWHSIFSFFLLQLASLALYTLDQKWRRPQKARANRY